MRPHGLAHARPGSHRCPTSGLHPPRSPPRARPLPIPTQDTELFELFSAVLARSPRVVEAATEDVRAVYQRVGGAAQHQAQDLALPRASALLHGLRRAGGVAAV